MIFWTMMVMLLVLWALALVGSYTLGGFIHLLPVAAVGMAAARLLGRGATRRSARLR